MSYDPKFYEIADFWLENCANAHCVQERHMEELAQILHDHAENYADDGDNFGGGEPRFDTRRERDEWRHEAAEWQRLK